MFARLLTDFKAAFVPLPTGLTRANRIFYHVYPIVLWLLGVIAAVRWTLYLIHIYNPWATFLPRYNRLAELLIVLGYTAPMVGWYVLKRWLTRDPQQAAAWDELTTAIEKPTLGEDDHWGGANHSLVVVSVVAAFLAFTVFFILRTAMRG